MDSQKLANLDAVEDGLVSLATEDFLMRGYDYRARTMRFLICKQFITKELSTKPSGGSGRKKT